MKLSHCWSFETPLLLLLNCLRDTERVPYLFRRMEPHIILFRLRPLQLGLLIHKGTFEKWTKESFEHFDSDFSFRDTEENICFYLFSKMHIVRDLPKCQIIRWIDPHKELNFIYNSRDREFWMENYRKLARRYPAYRM